MTISRLVEDVQTFDGLAWLQLFGFVGGWVAVAWLFYWLSRALLVNGDVVVEAEQILYTAETVESFAYDFIPTAARVALAEAHALPNIDAGLSS